MKTLTYEQVKAQNKWLKVIIALLVLANVLTFWFLKRPQDYVKFVEAGSVIRTQEADAYVKKYTDGAFVFGKTTTSFLLEKRLLDSFSTNPASTDTPVYYRIFFARNQKGDRTLVITGAVLKKYKDSDTGYIVNTHINGGYDIEHVFPIDRKGNVYQVNQDGSKKPIWTSPSQFPGGKIK